MSGHTPGPWEVCGFFVRSEYAMGERDKNGWLIATLDNALPNWGANARLIAASPELLEALRDLIHAHDLQMSAEDGLDDRYADMHMEGALQSARAAIQKATGASA